MSSGQQLAHEANAFATATFPRAVTERRGGSC